MSFGPHTLYEGRRATSEACPSAQPSLAIYVSCTNLSLHKPDRYLRNDRSPQSQLLDTQKKSNHQSNLKDGHSLQTKCWGPHTGGTTMHNNESHSPPIRCWVTSKNPLWMAQWGQCKALLEKKGMLGTDRGTDKGTQDLSATQQTRSMQSSERPCFDTKEKHSSHESQECFCSPSGSLWSSSSLPN